MRIQNGWALEFQMFAVRLGPGTSWLIYRSPYKQLTWSIYVYFIYYPISCIKGHPNHHSKISNTNPIHGKSEIMCKTMLISKVFWDKKVQIRNKKFCRKGQGKKYFFFRKIDLFYTKSFSRIVHNKKKLFLARFKIVFCLRNYVILNMLLCWIRLYVVK